jgi:hypothetical protein
LLPDPEGGRAGGPGRPGLAAQTTRVGQFLTDAVRAVARENPKLAFLKDVQDFNATASGQRILDEERLKRLIGVLNDPAYRLGLDDVEPDILGRAYEYLLRKTAALIRKHAVVGDVQAPTKVHQLTAETLAVPVRQRFALPFPRRDERRSSRVPWATFPRWAQPPLSSTSLADRTGTSRSGGSASPHRSRSQDKVRRSRDG